MPVRYMAVAFPAFAILLAIGYGQLGNWFTKWGVVLPLGGLSAMVILIPLVHYRPLLVDVDRYDRLPESAQPIENYQFESGVEIGGFSQGRTADDRLRLRLYMTTTEDIEEPLFAMVYMLDDNRIPIGRCGIVAGDSMWTTMNWKRGEMVAQEFYFESSLAVYFEIELYYLQNRYHLVNQYDLRRPDPRISGDLIKLE
jgi:hypothetical protein